MLRRLSGSVNSPSLNAPDLLLRLDSRLAASPSRSELALTLRNSSKQLLVLEILITTFTVFSSIYLFILLYPIALWLFEVIVLIVLLVDFLLLLLKTWDLKTAFRLMSWFFSDSYMHVTSGRLILISYSLYNNWSNTFYSKSLTT